MSGPFLTIREAAKLLRCTTRTVRTRVHQKLFGPYVHAGKQILIPEDGVRKYLDHRTIQ